MQLLHESNNNKNETEDGEIIDTVVVKNKESGVNINIYLERQAQLNNEFVKRKVNSISSKSLEVANKISDIQLNKNSKKTVNRVVKKARKDSECSVASIASVGSNKTQELAEISAENPPHHSGSEYFPSEGEADDCTGKFFYLSSEKVIKPVLQTMNTNLLVLRLRKIV